MRFGFIGAGFGFIVGLVFAAIMAVTEPVGPGVPLLAYAGMVFLITCFGAWQGGLIGISKENKKLAHFHDDIIAGKYLILIYAPHKNENQVSDTMKRLHPEARLVGVDSRFYNPFSEPAIQV